MAYDYTSPTGSGFRYGGINPGVGQTKVKNILSNEEISKLFQKGNNFSLAITEMERLKAICTHRFENGFDALQDLGNGEQRCQICQHEFMPVSVMTTKEDIKNQVDAVKDILQTIKLIYLDMPADAAREYFVLIALLDKIPDLFECGCKDYIRHEKFMPFGTYGSRTQNILDIYKMITGGAGPETYMQYDANGRPVDPGFSENSAWAYGNPVYNGTAWGNPMANGQPTFYQPYGQQPYGFGGQPVGSEAYAAQTQGYQYGGQPQPAPTDPNTNATATEVKATFKA